MQVKLFLETFLTYAQQPGPHVADNGVIKPDYPEFTGFVFKVSLKLYFSILNSSCKLVFIRCWFWAASSKHGS